MAVALASMASGQAVDPTVAMTGEVTLTGQVLPVGGIKEKVLAARAAGITRVFLPDRNQADIEEIRGDNLLSGLQFCYVEHVSAVFDQTLVGPKKRRPAAACGPDDKTQPAAARPAAARAREDGGRT
jgi:ATP-dependent Lon protease